jgi:hypothetical protein
MLNVKSTVLQIPTPRFAGFFTLRLPQANQAFLQEIFLQGRIAAEPGHDLA